MPRACGASSTPRLIDFITTVSGILDRPPSRTMTVRLVIASHPVGAKRRRMTGSAKQSIGQQKESMDCFVASLLAMTAVTADTPSRSRDMNCPRFASSFALLENRGRREDRVRAAPAVSCATCTEENAHEHTGPAESIRPSLRNGFTAYFVLSRRRIPLATVAGGLMVRPPGRAGKTSADLAPATGARTTRLGRPLQRRRQRASIAHRPKARPAIIPARLTLPRPPHPIPRFVTIAKRPSGGRDGWEYEGDLG